mmetsp:Transcript_59678/g.176832  ORF Transcript_59678/g.176832 Transcript_59678/m.176832 type:complete len:312 (+) Transcript_59678:401-1336(+)
MLNKRLAMVTAHRIRSRLVWHYRIYHKTENSKPPTPNSSGLRTLLRLQRCPGDATADRCVPNIVLSAIFFHETLRPAKHAGDKGKIPAPVETLFARGTHGRPHLLFEGGLRNFFPIDDGDGRGHVRHRAQENAHEQTAHSPTEHPDRRLPAARFGQPGKVWRGAINRRVCIVRTRHRVPRRKYGHRTPRQRAEGEFGVRGCIFRWLVNRHRPVQRRLWSVHTGRRPALHLLLHQDIVNRSLRRTLHSPLLRRSCICRSRAARRPMSVPRRHDSVSQAHRGNARPPMEHVRPAPLLAAMIVDCRDCRNDATT